MADDSVTRVKVTIVALAVGGAIAVSLLNISSA
jgi:hypothetical protein